MTLDAKVLLLMVRPEDAYADGGSGPYQAIRLMEPRDTAFEADEITLPYAKPTFGADPKTMARLRWMIEGDLPLQGSGTAGGEPTMAAVLEACGLTATTVTGTATVDATATPVGSPVGGFTYAVATGATPKTFRVVTLTCTTAGGSGTAAFAVTAPAAGHGDSAEAAYDQAAVVMTDGAAFALPNGGEITPTVTTAFDIGDTFTIGLGPARVDYEPSSDADGHASLDTLWYRDTLLQGSLGVRGSAALAIKAGDVPKVHVKLTGLYDRPADGVVPAVDWSTWLDPDPVLPLHTRVVRVHGYEGYLLDFSADQGAKVDMAELPGGPQGQGLRAVRHEDRQGSGSITIVCPDAAQTATFFAAVEAQTPGIIEIIHGTTPGKMIRARVTAATFGKPSYGEHRGMLTVQLPFVALPVDADDEFVWSFW